VAIQRDHKEAPAAGLSRGEFDGPQWENIRVFFRPYVGYAEACNFIAADLLSTTDAEWLVFAGDDIYPDPDHTADEIAAELRLHFDTHGITTFGVMQPTGDRWSDGQGPMSERVAGSAWCGREFCRRVNRGKGPLWHEYFHYCVDEELQEVATRLGIFWQCRGLVQRHEHYMRSGDAVVAAKVPAHLEAANADFMNARRKFATRKANGFPGSECLKP
jgi:hypothetical protein